MIPIINFKIFCLLFIVVILLTNVYSEKYKVCVVDGKGGFKRSGQFCPILDQPDSKVECVLGVDRLDCLRRISKGKVDFSVFTPEDLVTATNSEIEVLLTNELRYTKTNFEYEVVAIISNSSGIKTRHDLEGKKFCHPGYGYETDWTRILSNYLEASVVPQLCETQITITENRIKASSNFFRSACKAGPWVNDPTLDYELKRKYPNLCALCDSPSKCSTDDKYWGRRGALYCLTDGAGDITWARSDDVQYHFGLTSAKGETTPDDYSYLCPDDSIRSLKKPPCTWVVKPWPVIAAQRTKAQDIQDFISTLDRTKNYNTWQTALLNLIETYHQYIEKLEPIEAIESYLDRAVGFLNANSFTGCHPPRTIRICTTSIIENAKCNWLRESAAVYGIEPDLSCLKADNTTHCMMAINLNAADIVMITPDLLNRAEKHYNLKTLFYETVNDNMKYLTVAITKSNSTIKTLKDAQNKRVCLPNYDGVAWNSAIASLKNQSLINTCPYDQALIEYFNQGCIPQLPKHLSNMFKNTCQKNIDDDDEIGGGDYRAIKCLLDNEGDVAFISKNSLINFIENPNVNRYNRIKIDDFHTICMNSNNNDCHLSWAPIGQAMVRKNSTELWMKDTLSVFLQLDSLFGKNYKSLTLPLQIFGNFDGKSNILFHDDTVRLRNVPISKNFDNMKRTYREILDSINVCQSSSSSSLSSSYPYYSIVMLLCVLIKFILY